VSLGDLTVAVNAIRDGVISEIRLPVGHKGKVTKPIAIFVQNQKEYMSFLEEERQESLEAAKMAEAKSAGSDKGEEKKVDSKDLMRAVRHLIQTGMLDGESDVAKKMQGLARKSNPEMLSIFEASTDDGNYKPETFDYKFFLENATDVVKEQKEAL
jgi:pyruvate/2-oxoglutarate dehydrogenase complex dihydrolipoamide acyltransferase (E2) component